ncbi:MAG TPA: class I SAM-dependent methyltransferase [Thermoanaerobaculia bacterium]
MPAVDLASVRPELIEISPLIRFLSSLPKSRVIDLGAGAGQDSLYLASFGHIVTAVELDRTLCGLLRERARADDVPLTVLHSDIRTDSFCDGADVVILKYVSHLLNDLEFETVLRRMQDAVPVNGINALALLNLSEDRRLRLNDAYRGWREELSAERTVRLLSRQTATETARLFRRASGAP